LENDEFIKGDFNTNFLKESSFLKAE